MRQLKVWIGALIFMCALFVITPVAHAEDATKNGWVWEEDGYFYFENGEIQVEKMIVDLNGHSYYVGEDGRMVENALVWVDGGYRYFGTGGAMVTSAWQQVTTYYENIDEYYVEWYYFGVDGLAYVGIKNIDGVEYFFDESAVLFERNAITWNESHLVKVNSSGVVVEKNKIQYNEWTYIAGEWYWFDAVYRPADGMRTIYGYTYCFSEGKMLTDTMMSFDEKNLRAFDENGHMVENAWYFTLDSHWSSNQRVGEGWMYFGKDGIAVDGWFLYGSDWYYLEQGSPRIGDYIMDYYGQDIWYTFDTDGKMIRQIPVQEGWLQVGTVWYYYDGEELLNDEWATIDGYTYYFGYDGAMAKSDLIWSDGDFYVVDEYGHWVKSQWVALAESIWCYADENGKPVMNAWRDINSRRYYFDDVYMVSNPTVIDGRLELFGESGVWLGTCNITTGWIAASGSWYYLENSQLSIGWKRIDGKWYYFDQDNYLAYVGDYYDIDGTYYLFNENAALANGWVLSIWGEYFLSDNAGVLLTGWQQVYGTWYYLSDWMYADGIFLIDNEWHLFAKNGAWLGRVGEMSDGWQMLNNKWYYFENGYFKYGAIKSNGMLYYCEGSNGMIVNDGVYVDKRKEGQLGRKSYYYGFNESGVLARNQWIYLKYLEEWVWCDKEGMFAVNENWW